MFAHLGDRTLPGFLCRLFRLPFVLIHQMDERLDERVVDLAKAVIGKTEQIEPRRLGGQALEPENAVEGDQRGVVFAALLGDACRGKEGAGKGVQGLEDLPALDFLAQRLVGEVLSLLLEGADPVDILMRLEQGVKLLAEVG